MLDEKPWKFEAVLRLGLSLFICQILGMVAVAVIQVAMGGARGNPLLFCLVTGGSVILCAVSLFMVRKPLDLAGFTGRFALLLVSLYLALMLGVLAQYDVARPNSAHPVWRMVATALCFQGAALLLVGRFVSEHSLRWTEAFGFAQRWQRALLLGVLMAVLFLPVGWGLQWASAQFMTRVQVEPVEQQAIQTLRTSESWLSRAVLAVVAIGLAPLAEEILFRGILYPAVKRAGFRRLALWGTSVLFAVIHGNLTLLLPLLVLSLGLTLLYEKSNNLLAPVVAHALFNAINFLRLFLGEWLSG